MLISNDLNIHKIFDVIIFMKLSLFVFTQNPSTYLFQVTIIHVNYKGRVTILMTNNFVQIKNIVYIISDPISIQNN